MKTTCLSKYHLSVLPASWRQRFFMLLLLWLCYGCRTTSHVQTETERISGNTVSIESTLWEVSSAIMTHEEECGIIQIIETFSMDTLTGQTYLASRTTTTLNKESRDKVEKSDTLKECSAVEAETVDSIHVTSNKETVREETAVTPLFDKIGWGFLACLVVITVYLLIKWQFKL